LNLVADGVPAVAYAKLYARIRLPLPVKIYSVRPLDLSGVVLDPGGHFASKTATMVQVLEYAYQDFRKVMFGSQFLDIAPLQGKDGGMYMSLHVFTEEDQARPNDHTVSGFDAVAQLFNFNCPPVLTTPKQSPLMTAVEVPVGLTLMEFLDLAPRTREVAFIGRKLRQDVLLGGQKPMVAGPGTGSDPATCLLMVSRIKGASNAQS